MMNNTIFIQPSPNFQFLSVCNYITTFGIIFYNKDLITLDERNQSIPVLNTLFAYLHKSRNKSKAKLRLLKNALKGTHLYGGGDNETLDKKYVDETYQYIISTALFSHYGNINGYLAKIINRAHNVNFFALKKNVQRKLSENYITRDYCSLGNGAAQLTPLTIKFVFENYVWKIFPEPEQDMSIIDVNYIYAMVGLKIARSLSTDRVKLPFQEYITISREIDLQDFNNETSQIVLKFFATPALFFYAIKEKKKFRKIDQFNLNDKFWNKAYGNLFNHIDYSVSEIVQKSIENSLHYKLDKEINNLMSRTLMAYEILKVFCHYENFAQVSELHVGIYKTFFHWITKLLLPSRCNTDDLPKLDDVYEDQFTEVEKIYNQIEQNVITNVLIHGKLVERMNSNVSVLFARVPDYQQGCTYCPPPPRSKNKDIYLLFAINEGKKNDFYAFRQESNTLSLLTSNGNEREFAQLVANDASLKMEIAITANPLKLRWENYKMFVHRVAEIKTKQFLKGLKEYYYDEALGEKFLNFFKAFIPFYSCVESIQADDKAGAALSCTLDVLSLIPMAGFAAKYTTQLGTSLAKQLSSSYLIINTLARTGIVTKLPIIAALDQITKMAARTVAREILTRGFLTDFALASLRSVDPGFELFYQLGNFGVKTFRKMFRNMIQRFRSIPEVKNSLSFIKSVFENLKGYKNLVPDQTGLVPLVLAQRNGYNVVRYLYPGGSNFFGPTCVTSFGKSAELRSIDGYSFEIAVMPVKSPGVYKQYIPETGKLSDIKLQMGGNDILQRVGYLLDKLFVEGHDINLLRSYDVYHNTIHWNKPPTEATGSGGLIRPDEHPNSLVNPMQQDLIHQNSVPQNPIHQNPIIENPVQQNPILQNPIQQNRVNEIPLHQNRIPQNPIYVTPIRQNPIHVVQSPGNVGTVHGSNFPSEHYFPQSTDPYLWNPSQEYTAFNSYPQLVDPAFQITLRGNFAGNLGPNFPQTSNIEFSGTLQGRLAKPNLPQFSNPELPWTPRGFLDERYDPSRSVNPETLWTLTGEKVVLPKKPGRQQVESNIPEKIRRPDVTLESPTNFVPEKVRGPDVILENPDTSAIRVENLDQVPGSSKPFLTLPVPSLYQTIFKEPTYSRYVDSLLLLKKYRLSFIKKNELQTYFLRTAVNKMALVQLEQEMLLQKPNVLWYSQFVTGQNNVDLLTILKGHYFLFNDITMLTNKPFGRTAIRNLNPSTTEIRYRVTIDSSYGFVDLTHFHNEFRNNYIIFNDMLFTITNTFFTGNKKIFYVELKSHGMQRNLWKNNREQEIINLLQDGRIVESPRMESITKGANFMSDNAILCTLKSSQDYLKNFILRTKPSTSSLVPTYQMLAEDFQKLQFQHSYQKWIIKPHPDIQDVLFNHYLDEVSELSEAKRIIREIYGLVYFQNIPEAFESYRRILGITQHLRFEDYYVIYSHVRSTLVTNIDGVRRLEAAINRLSLRQCDQEWIMDPITLYHGEMISWETAGSLRAFQKGETFEFDHFKKFSREESVEMVNVLNQAHTFSEIPLFMEIKLNNQAGVADVSRIFNNENPCHIVTANFEFTIDDVRLKSIHGQDVLVMKMHDSNIPTESRMLLMTNRLHDLFSTETKFYSNSARNVE